MELLIVLRVLVRRRTLVVLGVVLSLAAGLAASGRLGGSGPAATTAWIASATVQVDMPKSLVADAYASAAAIQSEAVVLSDHLTTDVAHAAIARAARLPAAQITIVNPPSEVPVRPTPLSERTQEASATPYTPYVVVVGPWLNAPLVNVLVTGPRRDVARRLASAAVVQLRAATSTASTRADGRLAIRPLGAVRLKPRATGGHGAIKGVAVAVALFIAWCLGLVVTSGLARAWRGEATHAAAPAR